MKLDKAEDLIKDIRAGRMVVLMDDEDRENEGDLVMAAEKVTPEAINFMVKHARGLVCLPLTRERCERLKLPLMVDKNDTPFSTNFTVSIEAAEGVTTGISAADRAKTVLAAVKPQAGPEDIVMPGHIFPLMAQPGGVLSRAGHTEAGVDLARLAGLEPASVICEILKEDGTMARAPELVEFAREHDLRIGTIEDLIRYRMEHESSIVRESEDTLDTRFGAFRIVVYRDKLDDSSHVALVKGDISPDEPTLVRVDVNRGVSDILREVAVSADWSVGAALEMVAEAGKGVVVLLQNETPPEDLRNVAERYRKREGDAGWQEKRPEFRTVGQGSRILADLGAKKIRVMSKPMVMYGLAGFGLEVTEYIDHPQQDQNDE